jgi:hypothetical protein
MFRFFKKKMRQGMPISTDGFMNGIQWLAEAFEQMKVSCGHIEWSQGHIPTIVIDPILLNGTQGEVYPFKVLPVAGLVSIYLPSNSIMVNGTDFTSSQTGLTVGTVADWYPIESFSGSILNLYVQLSSTDGEYGKPYDVVFATSAPTYAGEQITIPVVDCTSGYIPLVQGALELDVARPDASTRDYNAYRSIAEFSTNNHTVEVEGFRAGTSAVAPFTADDDYTHKFALREVDTVAGTTFMRWYDSLTLLSDIKSALTSDTTWQGTLEVSVDMSTFDWGDSTYGFYAWYDDLDVGDKRFWEIGADEGINNGSAIGNTAKEKVIDLDGQTLLNGTGYSAWAATAFSVTGDLAFGTLMGHTITFNGDGTITWS